MAQALKFKRGRNANFSNQPLAAGEPAFILDTGKLYIGDGENKILINPDITNVELAEKLKTKRKISITGAATGNVDFDGTQDVNINLTLANSGVSAGVYPKVTVNNKGLITSGTSLIEADIPNLSLSKITNAGNVASRNIGTSAGNIPVLDSNGKLDTSIIPAIAISDTFVVENESNMLALTVEVGDIAIRTDLQKSYILKASPPTLLDNWQELLTPMSPVTSVSGKKGNVLLNSNDVGLGNVTNDAQVKRSEMGVNSGVATLDSSGINVQPPKIHTHDDRYYTEAEIDVKLSNKLGKTETAISASKLQTSRKINGVSFDGTSDIVVEDSTKISSTGSITANRVPVFSDISGKTIKDSGFTIEKSVPSDAKFTDTIYTHPSSHPASIIVEDSIHRFLTDAEKLKLNGIQTGAQVNTITGVKGSAESTYRTGNINLTPSNIGLGNVDNTSDLNKPISNAAQTALSEKLGKSENAVSATKLQTIRKINGVNFDGTSDITVADNTKEPAFSKNTAFNKNFGTTAGTVVEGNDARLSNSRPPTAHNHNDLYYTKTETNTTFATKDELAGAGNGDMLRSIYDKDNDGTVDNAKKVNGFTVESNVPTGAKFTDTIYTHPTTSGNKHIPSGGSSGQILRWSSDGTAVWGTDNNTTYSKVTTSADGLMSKEDKVKMDNIGYMAIDGGTF